MSANVHVTKVERLNAINVFVLSEKLGTGFALSGTISPEQAQALVVELQRVLA